MGAVNKVSIVGSVVSELTLDEKFGGEGIYKFDFSVPKPNGNGENRILVRISDYFNCFDNIKKGSILKISGSLRSMNKRVKDQSYKKLILSVFCSNVEILETLPKEIVNTAEVEGIIVNTPYFVKATDRVPQRCDLLLRVDRSYGKYTCVPMAFKGRNAEYVSKMSPDDKLHCEGFIKSRDFKKTVNGKTVSCSTVEFMVQSLEKMTNKDENSDT